MTMLKKKIGVYFYFVCVCVLQFFSFGSYILENQSGLYNLPPANYYLMFSLYCLISKNKLIIEKNCNSWIMMESLNPFDLSLKEK